MRGRPFAHQEDLTATATLLSDLLELPSLDEDGDDIMQVVDDYFILVHEDWNRVQALVEEKSERVEQDTADGESVHVLSRDLYVMVDGVRTTHVKAAWGKSATVLKVRLSGIKQGISQLRCLRPAFGLKIISHLFQRPTRLG